MVACIVAHFPRREASDFGKRLVVSLRLVRVNGDQIHQRLNPPVAPGSIVIWRL